MMGLVLGVGTRACLFKQHFLRATASLTIAVNTSTSWKFTPQVPRHREKEVKGVHKINAQPFSILTPRFLHPEELLIKNDLFATKDKKCNLPEDLDLGSKLHKDDFPLLKPPPPYSLVVTPATPRTPTSPLPSDIKLASL